ncbi:type II toxin-antitoxin system VapC family toxin [Pendulispora rubella]|uniref:type II toxin-antitoxin system VapC family toxin n=1 Tax=Pendulispora rubella TaxID=2741070 RepID=UPI00374E0269
MAVRDTAFTELPVVFSHAIRLRGLPPHHRDPFDRLLIAQAVDEGLTIVTHDREFGRYLAPVLWS